MNSIALYDADAPSALSFVRQRLRDAGITSDLTPAQTKAIEHLGGRASDLEIVGDLGTPIDIQLIHPGLVIPQSP